MSKTKAIEWIPDQGVYWLRHLKMAAFFGLGAGVVLWAMSNPHAWVGPIAAILAIGVRAVFLRSEALSNKWRMAEGHLISPTGVSIPLSLVQTAKIVFGDVVVITKTGDKYPIKYLNDPQKALDLILREIK